MIGVDLVFIPEFKKQLKLGKTVLLQKAFTKNELKNRQPEHLAGLWAAKEAVMKATGLKTGKLLQIEVDHRANGQPFVLLGDKLIEISIAHHGDYVVAVAKDAS